MNAIDQLFASRGWPSRAPEPAVACPTDEAFAAYAGALLPARDREGLEDHVLRCGECHELYRAVVDAVGVTVPARTPASVRIAARLVKRGIELLERLDLVIDGMAPATPQPALGALRGPTAEAPPASDLITIHGPGHGLDELELAVQTNGTARLLVRCHEMPELGPDEILSIVLDVDGTPREKRPFDGEPVSFAPIGLGRYRVRLVARAPGGPARELAEALLDFQS